MTPMEANKAAWADASRKLKEALLIGSTLLLAGLGLVYGTIWLLSALENKEFRQIVEFIGLAVLGVTLVFVALFDLWIKSINKVRKRHWIDNTGKAPKFCPLVDVTRKNGSKEIRRKSSSLNWELTSENPIITFRKGI